MNTVNEVLTFLHLENQNVIPFKGNDNKYYYTYLIIPTNDKSCFYMNVYFGMKITHSIKNDKYTGSGRKICNYINKYPNDYYKQYVGFYNNVEELQKAEYDLIHPHLNKEYCMNLKEGGGNAPLSEETKHIISESLKGNKIPKEQIERMRKTLKAKFNTPEMKAKFSKLSSGKNNPMYGKNAEDFMTPEAIKEKRRKQREAMTGRKGIFNELFMTPEAIKEKRRKFKEHMKGRKYMYKNNDLVFAYPNEVEKYIQLGYEFGRPNSRKNKYNI